jgi:RNA polymerase sigma factor (sigma-70 family)
MMNQQPDFELLRRFVRHADQPAFGTVVRRHLDLVYATAIRKVEDTGAAEEIAQNVFTALARKAWQFAPDDSLPAWLHRTTLLESKSWWRGELRRRRREQTAIELGTTMKTSDEQAALRALTPLLDEALLSLREKDRTALLLRYYERRSLNEVGTALGIREDAAQKRVASALERVALFFQRRGFKTATVPATAGLLEHTAASASAGTAALVIGTALQATPAFTGLLAWLARITSLSKVQTAAVCVALSAGPVAWQWHEQRTEQQGFLQAEAQMARDAGEFSHLHTELTKLHERVAHLEHLLADAAIANQHRAELNAERDAWKTQLRERLFAGDYRWPDDSPFVRIPKSVLPLIDLDSFVAPPGVIAQTAREFLGLSPDERERAEHAFQSHFASLDELMRASAYQTNKAQNVPVPNTAVASTAFALPPLGDSVKSHADELQENLKSILGEERWALVQPELESTGTDTLRRVLNFDAGERGQEVALWIFKAGERLLASYGWSDQQSMFTSGGVPLEFFLPEASYIPLPIRPRTGSADEMDSLEGRARAHLGFQRLPSPLSEPALAWFQAQAESRFNKKGNQ